MENNEAVPAGQPAVEQEFVDVELVGFKQKSDGVITLTKFNKTCTCPHKVQDFNETAYAPNGSIETGFLAPSCNSNCPLFRAQLKKSGEMKITICCGATPIAYTIKTNIAKGDVKPPLTLTK